MLSLHHWKKILCFLKRYFHKRYPNASKALDLALRLHDGQMRKNGLPYVVHPLWVTMLLVLLDLEQDLKKMYPDKEDAYIENMLDILYAASLLHDVKEDCVMVQEDWDGLDKKVFDLVTVLTKTHKTCEQYYHKISLNCLASLIKLADRANNLLTMESFSIEKIKEYITETYRYYIPLVTSMRKNYPQLLNAINVIDMYIFATTDTVADLLKIEKILQKRMNIEDILAVGQETKRAINKLMAMEGIDQEKKLHSLKVAKTLIILGITQDCIIAAAIMHEIPTYYKGDIWKAELRDFSDATIKIIEEYQIKSDVEEYYKATTSLAVILIRFANRINTVSSSKAIHGKNSLDKYIKEIKFYRQMYEYVKVHYVEKEDIIDIMYWIIVSMVRTIEAIQKKLSDQKS